MCGRFALYTSRTQIAQKYFDFRQPVDDRVANYNIAPGTQITLITAERHDATTPVEFLSSWWGFRPSWAKDKKAPTPINAKAETVATSPYFRRAFARQRGIIPADGFYEWRNTERGKQPYFIRHKHGEVLMMAGIWEPIDGEDTNCAIITQPAAPYLAPIHDRQPVLLAYDVLTAWLDPELTAREDIRRVTRALDPDELEAYPVSTAVNKPIHNTGDLIKPSDRATM